MVAVRAGRKDRPDRVGQCGAGASEVLGARGPQARLARTRRAAGRYRATRESQVGSTSRARTRGGQASRWHGSGGSRAKRRASTSTRTRTDRRHRKSIRRVRRGDPCGGSVVPCDRARARGSVVQRPTRTDPSSLGPRIACRMHARAGAFRVPRPRSAAARTVECLVDARLRRVRRASVCRMERGGEVVGP